MHAWTGFLPPLNEFYFTLDEFNDCGKVCLLAISRAIESRHYNILKTVSPVLHIIFIINGNKCDSLSRYNVDVVFLASRSKIQIYYKSFWLKSNSTIVIAFI